MHSPRTLGNALMLLVMASTVHAARPLDYSGTVDIDPAAGTLAASLSLRIPLDGDDERMTFFLNAGLNIDDLTGKAVTGLAMEPMPGNPDWSLLHVSFDPELAKDVLAFRVAYHGSPNMPDNGINSIREDWVELTVDSAWHPVQSTLLQPIDADLEIRLPSDWAVITSGEVRPIEGGYRLESRFPQPDIAFTAAPGLKSRGDDAMRIHYRALDDATADHVLDLAAACRDWLNDRFGPDSQLPPIRFTVTDREEGGYARSNYIALTRVDRDDPESLSAFLCHELGHYWSRGAPPMSVENWLNESFAVMLGALATRDLHGERAYRKQLDDWIERSQEAGTIWTPDNLDRRSYVINYKKGPWFLHRLRERIGADDFDRLLTRYALDPVNTTPGLLRAIETIAGSEAGQWASAQLAVDGPFTETMDR